MLAYFIIRYIKHLSLRCDAVSTEGQKAKSHDTWGFSKNVKALRLCRLHYFWSHCCASTLAVFFLFGCDRWGTATNIPHLLCGICSIFGPSKSNLHSMLSPRAFAALNSSAHTTFRFTTASDSRSTCFMSVFSFLLFFIPNNIRIIQLKN